MKNIILFSRHSLLALILAGSSSAFDCDRISGLYRKNCPGMPVRFVQNDGRNVIGFYARGCGDLIRNTIVSYLDMHRINCDEYVLAEVIVPSGSFLWLADALLRISVTCRWLTPIIKPAYSVLPQLAGAVKLDCHCQIADN